MLGRSETERARTGSAPAGAEIVKEAYCSSRPPDIAPTQWSRLHASDYRELQESIFRIRDNEADLVNCVDRLLDNGGEAGQVEAD